MRAWSLAAVVFYVAVAAVEHDSASHNHLSPSTDGQRTKRSLLVLLRGESFRADPSGPMGSYVQHHTNQACSAAGMAAQRVATATHAALFSSLSSAFDLQLQLHTYAVAGCTEQLQAMYQEAASVQPSIAFYDKASNDQDSVWTQAWTAVKRETPTYDAVLVLRFDAALRHPLDLAARIITISDARADEPPRHGSGAVMYATFPWLPNPSSMDWDTLPQAIELMTCRAYERWQEQGRTPFMNDIIHFFPSLNAGVAERMAHMFPSHESADCLTSAAKNGPTFDVRFLSNVPAHSASFECSNEVYYLTGRNVSSVPCTHLTASEYEEVCQRFLGGGALSRTLTCSELMPSTAQPPQQQPTRASSNHHVRSQ